VLGRPMRRRAADVRCLRAALGIVIQCTQGDHDQLAHPRGDSTLGPCQAHGARSPSPAARDTGALQPSRASTSQRSKSDCVFFVRPRGTSAHVVWDRYEGFYYLGYPVVLRP